MIPAMAQDQDLRRYKRIRQERAAKALIEGRWVDCCIVDISGGGASVEIDETMVSETQVVLCEPDLGIIAATVERFEPGRMVLAFGIDRAAKDRLIDRLTGLLNADLL